MRSKIDNEFEDIDHRTCRSICDAVGERLRENMRVDNVPSPQLQQLMEELRPRETNRV